MIRDTFKSDGFFGFYNGFVATVAREMPGYFFFFGGYEASKYVLASTSDMKTEPYGLFVYASYYSRFIVLFSLHIFDHFDNFNAT